MNLFREYLIKQAQIPADADSYSIKQAANVRLKMSFDVWPILKLMFGKGMKNLPTVTGPAQITPDAEKSYQPYSVPTVPATSNIKLETPLFDVSTKLPNRYLA